jgi:arginase
MANHSSMLRYQENPSNEIDLIVAPYGFGGTDNLAQEGAHSLLTEEEIVQKLSAIGMGVLEIHPPSLGPFEIQEEPQRVRNLDAIFTVNNWLADTIKFSLEQNKIPILLGGDGSLSLGSVAGLIEHYGSSENLGIIWLSNHMQNSSPRVTKSWNANRMVYTALTFDKDAKHSDFIALMNFRNLHSPGKSNVSKKNIVHLGINHKSAQELAEHKYYTMEHIDEIGIRTAIQETIEYLDHCDYIHLIIDVNAFDLSGVSNFSLGQLSYREALIIAREIDVGLRRKNKLSSLDIVEHCPSREAWDKRGETAEWMTDIICNIFGENIFNAARKY